MNTLADGAFHLACLAVTLLGVRLLARDVELAGKAPTASMLAGPLLLGVGVFNVAEGIVDHLLLGVHHVREGTQHTAWDVAFLAVFALIGTAGAWLVRSGESEARAVQPRTGR